VTIVDRKKDIIISGGENISSVHVEHVLCEHTAVLEAAVVPMADERWGEVPRAFVVLRPGAHADEADLVAWARTQLAGFEVPKRLEVVADLPKSGTGKVQKAVLRSRP